MRFSKAFIPTTKETPNDAVLASHIYLSRGGFIAQVASGLYNFLPLGLRVLQNIEAIAKEELDAAGCQEVALSFVTPAELWQESGRYEKFGKELLRFQDRKENNYVLGPTHEEMMVNIVRNRVTSYKQLPLNLYQVTAKFRDEARPRFGLMRGREFLMKDGYSFHASHEDMVREFDLMEVTYKKILDRLGLEYRVVEADSGAIGGSGSKEIMVIAGSGEDTLAICSGCEYGANVEAAKRKRLTAPKDAKSATSSEKLHTPSISTMEGLHTATGIDPYYMIKAVVKEAIFDEHSELVVFFLRGCDTLQDVKAANAVDANDVVDADEAQLAEARFVTGFIGPKAFGDMKVVYDIELQEASSMLCGANEVDYHVSGFAMASIENAVFADLAQVQEGDSCPHCDATMSYAKGIECGHIFQLGTKYSSALKASFLDEQGKQQDMVMGTYGLGISRLVAAVIEQHHDEKGCQWTLQSAPYQVNVMVSDIKKEDQLAFGERLYDELKVNGISTIIDDRKERFGFKIKDAELIGFPFTVIVGKSLAEGQVEILDRRNDIKTAVQKDDVLNYLIEAIKKG